jgi:hypothetical protein
MVRETIRGETRVDAHGPKDMPAWGLEASAGLGIVGGGIYDASLRCAIKAKAEAIYSWNGRHYAQCGPEVTRRLRTP